MDINGWYNLHKPSKYMGVWWFSSLLHHLYSFIMILHCFTHVTGNGFRISRENRLATELHLLAGHKPTLRSIEARPGE